MLVQLAGERESKIPCSMQPNLRLCVVPFCREHLCLQLSRLERGIAYGRTAIHCSGYCIIVEFLHSESGG